MLNYVGSKCLTQTSVPGKDRLPALLAVDEFSRHNFCILLASTLFGLSSAAAYASNETVAPIAGERSGRASEMSFTPGFGYATTPGTTGAITSMGEEINTAPEAVNGPWVLANSPLDTLLNVLTEYDIGYYSPFEFNDTPWPVDSYRFDLIITGNPGQTNPVIGVLIDEHWYNRLDWNQYQDFTGRDGHVLDSLYTSEQTARAWVDQRMSLWFPNGRPSPESETGELAAGPSSPALRELRNFPNPFNSTTRVLFELPTSAHVEFDCFDVLGHRISHQDLGVLPAGELQVSLNMPAAQASGQFFYMLFTDGVASATGKGTYIK